MDTIATHGGYITKGDNNPTSDQGSLYYANTGKIEPVQKDWVVGKALFAIPYVGLLPLNIGPVIVIVIILMVLHELYLRRKEDQAAGKTGEERTRSSGEETERWQQFRHWYPMCWAATGSRKRKRNSSSPHAAGMSGGSPLPQTRCGSAGRVTPSPTCGTRTCT